MNLSKLVFWDESGVNTNMSRLYARAWGGARANDAVPFHTGVSTTMLSSVRASGETVYTTFSGAVNGALQGIPQRISHHIFASWGYRNHGQFALP